MATTLPTVSDVIGGVRPTSLPGVSVPRDAFADPEPGGKQLQAQVSSFVLEQHDNNTTTEAQDLANELNKTRREMLDGTVDKPGYTSLVGREAVDQRKALEEEWEKKRQEIVGRASGGAVSRKLSANAARQNEMFLSGVGSHYKVAEKKLKSDIFAATTSEQSQNSISQARITDFNNAESVAKYNTDINAFKKSAYRHYMDEGTGDAKSAMLLAEKDVADIHQDVIKDMLIEQPLRAQAYFEKYQGQIPEKFHDDILKPLKVSADLQQATNDVAEFKTLYGGLDTADERQKADAALVQKYGQNAKRLEASRKALKAEFARIDTRNDEREEELLERAIGKMSKARLAGNVFDVKALSAEEYQALAKDRAGVSLLQQASMAAPLVAADKSRVELGNVLDQIDKMQKGDIPVMSATYFESKYSNKLNDSDYKQANNLLRSLRAFKERSEQTLAKQKAKAAEQAARRAGKEGLNDNARILNSLTKSGFYTLKGDGKATRDSKNRRALFAQRMDQIFRDEATRTGDALTTDRKQQLIDAELLKIVYIEDFGTPTKALGPLVTDERADGDRVYAPFDTLKEADLTEMQRVMKEYNVRVPEDRANRIKLFEDFAGAIRRGRVHTFRFLEQKGRGDE